MALGWIQFSGIWIRISVIPAKAGIQILILDPRFRGDDGEC